MKKRTTHTAGAYVEWRYCKALERVRAILRVRCHDGKHRSRCTTIPDTDTARADQALALFAAEVNGNPGLSPSEMASTWLTGMGAGRFERPKPYYRSKITALLAALPPSFDEWTREVIDASAISHRDSVSRRSYRMLVTTMDAFLTHARRRGLTHLPLRLSRIARAGLERRGPSRHTPDEIGRLLGAPAASGWPVVPLAYYAGLRRGEIRSLSWDDVGPKSLVARPARAGLERVVEIGPDLYPYLAERGEGLVVKDAGRPAVFYKRLRLVYEQADVEYPDGRPMAVIRASKEPNDA